MQEKFKIFPVFGIELEFYIEGIEADLFLDNIEGKISSLEFSCEKESSIHQYEVKSGCYTNSNNLIKHSELVKELLTETANELGGNISFKAKPYLDRAGNALNVHVNLVDLNNNNLFYSSKQKYSDYLLYSIGGLCAMMKKHMLFFAPNDDSYLRFQYPDIHTPTTVSWGVNNRTTAIRIPDFTGDLKRCRLEHRVPGADCNLKEVMTAIIEGMIFGIENKIVPPNRVYGIASDPQYRMEKLIYMKEAV
ncbi:MAG: glutamine synthetase [Wolbachia sp.]|nr:glutamine synthetase [Wolbachia sp.]